MKKIFVASLLFAISLHVYSQSIPIPKIFTGRKHRGFYLSMAMGVNSTNIDVDSKNFGHASYKGIGGGMDFKIGGAVSENFIIHATLIGHGITGPKIESDDWGGSSFKADDKVSFSQGLIGGGVTYYTSDNFLLSSSIGFGGLSVENEREDLEFSTDNGFSYQLKAGKEWWVSPMWAIGFAIYYHNINCMNQEGNFAEERIKSNSFGFVFNITRNGRK